MNPRGFYTLFYKEVLRFGKVWLQTLGAPIITSLLYLLVFAHVLEGRMEVFEGVSYSAFLIPGLMMMSLIQNAFANSSSSIIQSKVTGNIVFLLLAPLSYLEMYLAFMLAAVVRGLVVGTGVLVVGIFFVDLPVHSVVALVLFGLLSGAVLATFGVIAGIWAEKFDQLAGAQNFIIMPLSFLSGVFYSIHSLPPFWQQLSHFNPFFYMIDGFRYGFFGVSDVDPGFSLVVLLLSLGILAMLTLSLLSRGYRLRD
ncbi:MAG: metal-dependent hydrolase [Acidithiobacillales bacterium SG8_45]|jgi:ABC-2 type transport system permease protein|nr:MAG: metal-dependent hydrolase [Acidithiobacillales bacterium SG8_45]